MRKFLDAKKDTLSTFRYNSIINFLALTLTMSRHAVKVSNQEEGTQTEINIGLCCTLSMCGKTELSLVLFYVGSKSLNKI